MKHFFDKKYPVTDSFQNHINSGRDGGTDYGTPIGTPIYAPEQGNAGYAVDQYGGLYVDIDIPGIRMWRFVHLSKFNGSNRAVREGETIGWSGNSGWSTGAHTHVGLHTRGSFVDVENYMNRTNQIQRPANKDMVIVQVGWGISNVALEAGLDNWRTQEGWQYIAELNGYSYWGDLQNKFISGEIIGQELRIKKAEEIKEHPELEEIRRERESLEEKKNDLLIKEEATRGVITLELQKEVDSTRKAYEEKIELLNAIRMQSDDFKVDRLPPIDWDNLVDYEFDGKSIKRRYFAFIEKKFSDNRLHSFFKYDIFYLLASGITKMYLMLQAIPINEQNAVMAGILSISTGFLEITFKQILTNERK